MLETILAWVMGLALVVALLNTASIIRDNVRYTRSSALRKEGRMNQLFTHDRLSNQQWSSHD